MAEDLRVLAADFVRLSSELEATREAMKRLLINGAGEQTRPTLARRRPGGKEAETREGDRQPPQGNAEPRDVGDCKATGSPSVTVQDRLRRLRLRGEIEGGGKDGWRATATA